MGIGEHVVQASGRSEFVLSRCCTRLMREVPENSKAVVKGMTLNDIKLIYGLFLSLSSWFQLQFRECL